MLIYLLLVEISIIMVNIVDPYEVWNWIDHYYDNGELFFYFMMGFLHFWFIENIYQKKFVAANIPETPNLLACRMCLHKLFIQDRFIKHHAKCFVYKNKATKNPVE